MRVSSGPPIRRSGGLRPPESDSHEQPQATTTLWRPTGPKELDLVRELNWRAWPPRLPEQPIFYPVLNEDYAIRIARDWNVKHDGAGFVTRFEVDSEFLCRYPVQQAAWADDP